MVGVQNPMNLDKEKNMFKRERFITNNHLKIVKCISHP